MSFALPSSKQLCINTDTPLVSILGFYDPLSSLQKSINPSDIPSWFKLLRATYFRDRIGTCRLLISGQVPMPTRPDRDRQGDAFKFRPKAGPSKQAAHVRDIFRGGWAPEGRWRDSHLLVYRSVSREWSGWANGNRLLEIVF